MIRTRRAPTTLLAGALATGALAGPAVAQHDIRVPQDQRSPDVRDAAEGRHIVASTPFEVVKVERVRSQFDWGDAAIGAGGTLGIVLLSAGGATAVARRRYSPPIAH